jgi:hypothetical protein
MQVENKFRLLCFDDPICHRAFNTFVNSASRTSPRSGAHPSWIRLIDYVFFIDYVGYIHYFQPGAAQL